MSLFTIKIFKSWGGRNPDRRWANAYEIESTALTPWGLGAAVDAIVAAEKTIHLDQVNFLSATVSTWEPDGTPYNPLSFYTLDLSGVGVRGQVDMATALDSNVCYVMRYMVQGGRNGRRFYRGCLLESEVQSGGDLKFTLAPGTNLTAGGASFLAFRTAILPYIGAGVGDHLVLVGGPGDGVLTRRVVEIVPGGISVNKRNHRYFDKA